MTQIEVLWLEFHFCNSFNYQVDLAYRDLPITALMVISDKSRCPVRHVIVDKSLDTNCELELWTNGLFGKKSNRFICYTKESPINNVKISIALFLFLSKSLVLIDIQCY